MRLERRLLRSIRRCFLLRLLATGITTASLSLASMITNYSGSCSVKDQGGNIATTIQAPGDCSEFGGPGFSPTVNLSTTVGQSLSINFQTALVSSGQLGGTNVIIGSYEISSTFESNIIVSGGQGQGILTGQLFTGRTDFGFYSFSVPGVTQENNFFSLVFTYGIPIHFKLMTGASRVYSGYNFLREVSDASISLNIIAPNSTFELLNPEPGFIGLNGLILLGLIKFAKRSGRKNSK